LEGRKAEHDPTRGGWDAPTVDDGRLPGGRAGRLDTAVETAARNVDVAVIFACFDRRQRNHDKTLCMKTGVRRRDSRIRVGPVLENNTQGGESAVIPDLEIYLETISRRRHTHSSQLYRLPLPHTLGQHQRARRKDARGAASW